MKKSRKATDGVGSFPACAIGKHAVAFWPLITPAGSKRGPSLDYLSWRLGSVGLLFRSGRIQSGEPISSII
jgi:hypothetical protein